jgi:hypothetical protein
VAVRAPTDENRSVAKVLRSRATFRLGADLFTNPGGALPDAAKVTAALGIEPSRIHDAGKEHGARAAPWKHGQWALTSPLPEESELETHLGWLLERLVPGRERIAAVVASDSRLKVDFYCGLSLANPNEGLSLTAHTLEAIGSLGAKLELDIYWDGSSGEPSRSDEE